MTDNRIIKDRISRQIDEDARAVCLPGNKDRGSIILDVTDYYVRYMFHVEPSGERAAISTKNRNGYNALSLFKAIRDAVDKYDPVAYPGISLMQIVGDTVNLRKSEILPIFVDGELLPPDDKKAPEPIKKYWKLLKAARDLEIDIGKISDEQKKAICGKMNIDEKKFNAILHAAQTVYTVSLDSSGAEGDPLETSINSQFDGIEIVEFKLWLMSWFVWLAKKGAQNKQYAFKMINTNWVLNRNFYLSEFPDHTHAGYSEFIKDREYADVTIRAFIETRGRKMSKENFSVTYRKPYNTELIQYSKNA